MEWIKESIKSHKKVIKELKKEIIQLEKNNNSHERINYLKNTILQGLDDLRYYNELLAEYKKLKMVRISTKHHTMLKELSKLEHRSMTNYLEAHIENQFKVNM